MSTPDEPAEQREVLSSLPRSRRQRPSARREAARAGRASKPKAATKATASKATAKRAPKKAAARTKPGQKAKPRARKPAPARSVIPPAGYATPRKGKGHGSADPGAAISGLVRSVWRRLPF